MKAFARWGPGLLLVLPVDRPHRRLRLRPDRLERQGLAQRLAAGRARRRAGPASPRTGDLQRRTPIAWDESVHHLLVFTGDLHRRRRCSSAPAARVPAREGRSRARASSAPIYLFPLAVSFIAAGVVWRWLMNPAPGDRASGLNVAFDKLGIGFLANDWYLGPELGDGGASRCPRSGRSPATSWPSTSRASAAFPEELREAARMDGASEWRVYRHVVFPHLTPGDALGADHPRPHLDQGLRPDRRHRRQAAHHADACRLHVDPHLRRARLREGRGDRDDPAPDRDLDPGHPVSSIYTVRTERRA